MKLKRTHMCGELRAAHQGQVVTVAGWVDRIREIGGVVFIDLRDREGVVQLSFTKEHSAALLDSARELGREYVIAARAKVIGRGQENTNAKLATGEVELLVDELEVLNSSKTPPLDVRDHLETNPELRMKYRYIDLRRPKMHAIIKLRHRLIKSVRDYLDGRGFYEIETPLLTKPTPEGARDFLVPARLMPGNFYALPQSPQIFKQILMIAGFDRYFQFARCMRDEDKRGDRQPEHTQLDFEMSFVRPADVQAVIEGVLSHVMKSVLGVEIKTPLPHLQYREAMRRFGSDKPDTRFGMELVTLTDELRECGFGVFANTIKAGNVVKALRLPGGNALVSKGQFKALETDARGRGAKGLAFIRYTDEGLDSSFTKFLNEQDLAKIQRATGAERGDLLLFVADKQDLADQVLSSLRLQFGEKLGLRDAKHFNYLWVDNFPQFEYDAEKNLINAAHHPFVMPENPEQLLALADELRHSGGKATPKAVDHALAITASQYDLVVNGVELGSGSLRITDPNIQSAMFTCLGISPEQAQQKFGFLLNALSFGAPPMAGIGIGVDRWLMVLLGLDTITEVIAFPKTSAGKGLMDESPAPADPELLKELRIQAVPE
ncbi:MAG: aspartate--tRNA ligase [Planctomycetota bacterium]